MKNLFSSLLLLAGLVAATGCAKDETVTPPIITASGALTGAQEAPAPNNSTATGSFTSSYNQISKVLTYNVTFSGLTPTMGHFHLGGPGVAGSVFVPFDKNNAAKDGYVSPIAGTTTLSDPAQIAAVTSGAFYANLHTVAYPNGEIRANATVK